MWPALCDAQIKKMERHEHLGTPTMPASQTIGIPPTPPPITTWT